MKIFKFAEELAKQDKEEESKAFFKQYLTIEPAIPSSSIMWENIRCSARERSVRKFIVMLIATIIVVLSFYGMVKFKDYGDSLLAQAPTSKCPKTEIGVEEAFLDS